MSLVTEADFIRLKSHAKEGTLKQGAWNRWRADGKKVVCMMSGLVVGATSPEACVTKGWPRWLASLNTTLFDSAPDIKTATQFAFDLAKACMIDRDYNKIRDLFLISRLDKGKHSALKTLKSLDFDTTQQEAVVSEVVALLIRRVNGGIVDKEMQATCAANNIFIHPAADAAADAAAYATDTATDVATYATDTDAAANAARAVAHAAAYAVTHATRNIARAQANSATRSDLITAINSAN